MKIHRFLGEFNFGKEEVELKDEKLVHQLASVLRMKPGTKLELVSSNGTVALVELIKINPKIAEAKVLKLLQSKGDDRAVALFVSILKRENFEWVVQKATEIGVTSITPLISKRTVKTGLKEERLQKIITEATEQSGRTTLLRLEKKQTFEEAANSTQNFNKSILFDESGDKVRSLGGGSESVALFVGPEGGWDDSELITARELGFAIISLGETTLRAETAAVVASYLGVSGL